MESDLGKGLSSDLSEMGVECLSSWEIRRGGIQIFPQLQVL